MKRPLSVTVIACLSLAGGAFSLITLPIMLIYPGKFMALVHSALPFAVQVGLTIAAIPVLLTAGFGLLAGANWARYLYIFWRGVGLLQAIAMFRISPQQVFVFLVDGGSYAVFVYLLMRSDADAYFRGVPPSSPR